MSPFFRNAVRTVEMDALGLQAVRGVESLDARGEGALEAPVIRPAVEPLPDRRMADLSLLRFGVDANGNTFPRTAGVELGEDIVEDVPERNLWLLPSFRKGEVWEEVLRELLFGELDGKCVALRGIDRCAALRGTLRFGSMLHR